MGNHRRAASGEWYCLIYTSPVCTSTKITLDSILFRSLRSIPTTPTCLSTLAESPSSSLSSHQSSSMASSPHIPLFFLKMILLCLLDSPNSRINSPFFSISSLFIPSPSYLNWETRLSLYALFSAFLLSITSLFSWGHGWTVGTLFPPHGCFHILLPHPCLPWWCSILFYNISVWQFLPSHLC